jgi:hypothetical protein
VGVLKLINHLNLFYIMESTATYPKTKTANGNADQSEGKVARVIEEQTAKLPSDIFLWASLGAMAASLTLKILKKDETALFVGQWSAPFLLLGIYNKMVKQEGHEGEK